MKQGLFTDQLIIEVAESASSMEHQVDVLLITLSGLAEELRALNTKLESMIEEED